MNALGPRDAIVLEKVAKHFKKTKRRREYTTFKSELIDLLRGLRKVVEPTTHIEALKGIDLRIPRGSTVAIVGRNGSGKSTLLKLITGIYTPSSGRIEVNGRISALLELGAGFHPDFTGRENILINGIILGMTRAEVKDRIDAIIEFAELGDFIDEPVRTYSSGMFMRLAFAVATHVDPEILIVDEILSVGDEHFQKKSYAKMMDFKRAGKTILMVTHNLGTVESWCDKAAWIDGGRTRMFGDPREVVNEYRRAMARAESESELTGHSALSMPGLALPGTNDAKAAPETVTLTAMRLSDGQGAQPKIFTTDGRLEVLLDWTSTRTAAADFTLDLVNEANAPLFTTTLEAGELPPGRGTMRLTLPRLGLGEGGYAIVVSVHRPYQPPLAVLRQAFAVAPCPGAGGLVRPEHAWSVERGSEVQPAPSPLSASNRPPG